MEVKTILFTCLIFGGWTYCYADICVKKSACSCIFSNGSGIDLAPTVTTTFYQVGTFQISKGGQQYDMQSFYFHPCQDILLVPANVTGDNTCTKNLSLAMVEHKMTFVATSNDTYKMDAGTCNYLGDTTSLTFSSDGLSLIYDNKPSSTIINLICAETPNQLHLLSTEDPKNYLLEFYSKDACLKQLEEPGRSFGSTLLIIFFSFVIFYLVLGVATRKFLMGATGLEVIPNLGFWMDLPNLVKDGWAYIIGGFRLPGQGVGPTATPDPNSYDSI